MLLTRSLCSLVSVPIRTDRPLSTLFFSVLFVTDKDTVKSTRVVYCSLLYLVIRTHRPFATFCVLSLVFERGTGGPAVV